MTKWKEYVLWFAQEHVQFRYSEIQSIVKTLNIPIKYAVDHNEKQPFWLVELPNDAAAIQLAARSMSLKCVLELWSHSTCTVTRPPASCMPRFHKRLQDYIQNNEKYVGSLCDATNSFKITVDTFNRHFTQREKVEKIENIAYLPCKGSVNLRNPDICWYYIEYYGLDPLDIPEEPLDVIFGKWLSDGRRSLLKEISLKTRKFIGNTSMDPQLSMLMANQAMVKAGDLVLDPFVGSGSLLVAAAKCGAYVMGTDIDYMMLHAKTRPSRITQKVRERDESIRANLKQYQCDQLYLDVIVSDFSKQLWTDSLQFDSIITDPPYGIREATEKVESKERVKENTQSVDEPHFPSTSHYSLSELFADLLRFAVLHLKMRGRLVCWIPIYKTDYSEEITIPKHSCLKLIANCEQDISSLTSRRLLTYEKIADLSAEEEENEKREYFTESVGDFRTKFFDYSEETRQVRRIRKAELKEIGRLEALKRGKCAKS